MEIKARGKYIKWITSIGFVLILLAGVIVGTLLNKDNEVDLKITAEDISVVVGDAKPLKYQASIKNVAITFRVKDKAIAEVSEGDVLGKAVGTTELTITARYKSFVCEKRVGVSVLKKDEEPTEPDVKDNEEIGGDNNDDNHKEEEPILPEKEELTVNISKIMGCTINEKTIEMSIGKTARIQLVFEEEFSNFELISSNEALIVTEAEEGQRVVVLSAIASGEYEFLIKIGNKEAKISVIVKE